MLNTTYKPPQPFYDMTKPVKEVSDSAILCELKAIGEPGCFLHNSRYDFNDEVLPLGAALYAGLVEQSMPLPV